MTILPPVMPDEFVLGYWGRIHALNLYGSPNQTLKALIENFALQPTRIQRVQALALAAQTSTQLFVQKHTLIPALAAISQDFEGAPHGNESSPDAIMCSWKRLQKKGAYFCPQCSAAHKSQWGFSYWMRHHQLLGVDWCLHHGTPLIASDEHDFVRGSPHIHENQTVSQRPEQGQAYWSVLERYSQIMAAYLNTTRRMGIRDATKRLRPIAAARSINIRGVCDSHQYLSDIAITKLPSWWLEKLFPSIAHKQTNSPFPPLDNTVLPGFAMPHAYALAMALLYESSEEALAGMLHQPTVAKCIKLHT